MFWRKNSISNYYQIFFFLSLRVIFLSKWSSDRVCFSAYKKEKGDYKGLRSVKTPSGETTWDIERNRNLRKIIDKIKQDHVQWFETDVGDFRGLPTKEHVQCIMLGYSPEPSKLKKLVAQVEEKFGSENNEDMEIDEIDVKGKAKKRKHDSSSSDDDKDEEPEKKSRRSTDEEKAEKEESGLGFKDKEKALQTIKLLEGRDLNYQYHAISGLVKRAERVISCTKDEQKLKNIKEAVEVFDNWITDFKVNGRAKMNFDYLSVDLVRSYKPLADKYKIEDNGFLKWVNFHRDNLIYWELLKFLSEIIFSVYLAERTKKWMGIIRNWETFKFQIRVLPGI